MGKGARGPAVRFCATHLTRTPDGKEFFIDVVAGVNECYSGTMEIETGKWTTWGSHELHMNHGQVNPQNGDLAMCACDWWTRLTDGKVFGIPSDENGNYLRLWTVTRDGKWTNYPPRGGFATHEYWSLDGKKIYYNNLEGIQRINLKHLHAACSHTRIVNIIMDQMPQRDDTRTFTALGKQLLQPFDSATHAKAKTGIFSKRYLGAHCFFSFTATGSGSS
jgi:hypothetical protein